MLLFNKLAIYKVTAMTKVIIRAINLFFPIYYTSTNNLKKKFSTGKF